MCSGISLWFSLHFSNDCWCWTYLSSVYFFNWVSVQIFWPFLKLGCLFSYWILRGLYFFEFNLYGSIKLGLAKLQCFIFTKADGREARAKSYSKVISHFFLERWSTLQKFSVWKALQWVPLTQEPVVRKTSLNSDTD